MVTINIDASQMRKLEKAVANITDGVPRVLAPAINRALDKGRTEVRREIRKIYLIKQKDIPISVVGASKTRLGGSMVLKDRMLPLDRFKLRPTGIQRRKSPFGVFAQVKRGGGGQMPGAFFIPDGGPYIRKGKARLPIKRLLSISAPIMASQPTVQPAVSKAMEETLAVRIDHEMNRVLANAGGTKP
jgi:hypothetical protein